MQEQRDLISKRNWELKARYKYPLIEMNALPQDGLNTLSLKSMHLLKDIQWKDLILERSWRVLITW